jgi:HlyD family secretion protein
MANGKSKKSKKKLFVFGGLGALILVVILLVVLGGNKEEIIIVQTEKAATRTITQIVSATGKINPVFQVKITAEASGEIVSLLVREGDKVKKGQLLLRIKPDIYEAQKTSADARLAQAKANESSTRAQLDQVEAEYKRVQGLFKKGLASDSDLETSKSTYLQTLGSFESQKSIVAQTESALKEAKETLYKTYIYAPMDGTVSALNVELGERVIGSEFQGTELLTVADLSQMEATVDVDENDVVMVSLGDTATIKVDAFGDKTFKGVVTQIGNSATATGTGTQDEVVNFEVEIRLSDPDNNIRPGMSCDADISTETKQNVVSIPIQSVTARIKDAAPAPKENDEDDAIVKQKNGNRNKPKEVVFLADNGKAKMVEVETGISDDTYIEIKSGLNGKEEVISGPYKAISKDLENGKVISVTNAKQKSEGKK